MTPYQKLQAELKQLNQRIEEAYAAEQKGAIRQIRELMDCYGLTARGCYASSDRLGTSIKGRKVRPKYRDPITGTTWSGRGRAPRWLDKTRLEAFLIEAVG